MGFSINGGWGSNVESEGMSSASGDGSTGSSGVVSSASVGRGTNDRYDADDSRAINSELRR